MSAVYLRERVLLGDAGGIRTHDGYSRGSARLLFGQPSAAWSHRAMDTTIDIEG